MTHSATRQEHEPVLEPLDETVDHIRGSPVGRLILQYGDYECPYSRQAFRRSNASSKKWPGYPLRLPAFPADRDSPARPRRGRRRGRPQAVHDYHRAKDPDAPDDNATRVLDQSRRYIEDFDQMVAPKTRIPAGRKEAEAPRRPKA